MKKVLKVVGIILVIFLIIGAIGSSGNKDASSSFNKGVEDAKKALATTTPVQETTPTTAATKEISPAKSERATVLEILKAEAMKKWKDDYSMVKYELEKQTEAYDWVVKQTENLDIMKKAKQKWGNDYSMVKYEYEKQVEAFKAL
jgi:hypothetical protein